MAGVVALLAVAVAVAACGEDGTQAEREPAGTAAPASTATTAATTGAPSSTTAPTGAAGPSTPSTVRTEPGGPAWELAERLGCVVDVEASTAYEGVEYMAPVRGGVMSDGVHCSLASGDQVHIFARDPAGPELSDADVAQAFTHEGSVAASAEPGCDPWLVLGPTWAVRLVSEAAAADVAAALAPEARAPERTTRTPISLPSPPCRAG